jgi:phosphoenolpyruvate carboxylase
MERALKLHYPSVTAPARWLTFGSWIGGDRDGNPNVTAGVTQEVLELHRLLAMRKLASDVRELGRSLTVSDRRETITAEMRKLLRENRHLSKRVELLTKRYPHEPYRLVLAGLHERLETAVRRVPGVMSLPESALEEPMLCTEDVREILGVLAESLSAGRGAILAGGELRDSLARLDVFGLHTARLDLRQHSGPHEAAVAELLALGRQVVVTGEGSFTELPPELVTPVPVGCTAALLAEAIDSAAGRSLDPALIDAALAPFSAAAFEARLDEILAAA